MCFINNKALLDKIRARKRSFLVWKTGFPAPKTGEIQTSYDGHKVDWIKGQTARPHRIRQPLQDREKCSAGLYFYMGSHKKEADRSRVVLARVQPQDVIAADGTTICCVAAEVVKSGDPEQKKTIRRRYLKGRIEAAQGDCDYKDRRSREWEEERDDAMEALQAMKDQLETLEPQKARK